MKIPDELHDRLEHLVRVELDRLRDHLLTVSTAALARMGLPPDGWRRLDHKRARSLSWEVANRVALSWDSRMIAVAAVHSTELSGGGGIEVSAARGWLRSRS